MALLFVGMISMSAPTGVDRFEVYLNNKLLLKHTMLDPLNLQTLKLTEANADDQLKIVYQQCNAPGKIGKGRKIALRDEQGAMVKEWKFADGSDANNMMIIPVKEILELQAKNQSLSMYYSAQQLPAGRLLTKVGKATKPLAALTIQNR